MAFTEAITPSQFIANELTSGDEVINTVWVKSGKQVYFEDVSFCSKGLISFIDIVWNPKYHNLCGTFTPYMLGMLLISHTA